MKPAPLVKVKDSIATHLLKVVFSFYLVLTIAVTLAHIYVEFSNTKEKVKDELEVIGKTFEPGLAKALWDYNLEQLQPVFLGMAESPDVEGIKLEDEFGKVYGKGRIINKNSQVVDIDENGGQQPVLDYWQFSGLFQHSFTIEHSAKEKSTTIGRATIYSSSGVVIEKVKWGFFYIIINAVIKTVALWILFLVISRKLLSRPLAALTEATQQIDLDKLDNLEIAIETRGQNELKILEEAFNAMLQKLNAAKQEILDKAHQLTERNEALVDLSAELKLANHRLTTILENTKALAAINNKKSAMLLTANTLLQEIPFSHFPKINIVYQDIDAGNKENFISFCPSSGSIPLDEDQVQVNTMDSAELVFSKILGENPTLPTGIQPETGYCLTDNQLDLIVRHGETLRGVISVQDIDTSVITDEHLAFIDTLAHFLSLTIEKIEMNQGLERKISERSGELIQAFQKLASQHDELKSTQQQLVQSEKLASIGTLTAGVAHEINNPNNFAHAAVYLMQDEIKDIKAFLKQLAGGEDADPQVIAAINNKFTKLIDLTNTAREGTNRIKVIVSDLRAFSRPDDSQKERLRLSNLIQSTMNLVRTQYTDIDITTDFMTDPKITCFPAKLSQVFMNIAVNACQAIETKTRQNNQLTGNLTITLTEESHQLKISFKDNGCGMDEATRQKIFDPFFTTKDVGSGTGLGMAISFGIIEEHGGKIKVTSAIDEGTNISIYLPLNAK
ncbi:HAMP domain-containing protein [Thalassomonas viridans]|uniref:histidine kinase n=1 Tax=Thalassomonas viridans TaxID=137584 RepID=A0AAF0CBV5_9GAMM|nr:ATP-binding protein [Thalassomonas viridans]WDE07681.1 HAMP domain-containing protein [Thalassomonas viridans]